MTPHMPAVTADQVINIARLQGFSFHRQKGSHAVYYRESDKARLVIPMHSGKIIKPKTLKGVINDMGLTIDEFRALL